MKERLQVDRREIVYEPDDAAIEELERLRPSWFDSEIHLARLFARIDRKAAYIGIRAASVEELAARRGYDGPRAHDLTLLGHALAALPELEQKLREGSISFHAATVLGYVYRNPLFLEEGDDWLALAEEKSFRDLWRRIRRRLESVRHGAPAVRTLRLDLPEDALEDIEEAQQLAVKRAGEGISKGQLFHALSVFFLRALDPLWKPKRKRRMALTKDFPRLRGVARETRRELKRRSGGQCEIGRCERVAQDLCHIVRHADGSGREEHDLVCACRLHHKLFDAGKIRFLGWTKEEDLPLFQDALTGEILAPKPRPEERERKPFPRWLQRIVGIVRRRPRPAAPTQPKAASQVPDGREVTPQETRARASAPARLRPAPPPHDGPLPPGAGTIRERRRSSPRARRLRGPRSRRRTYDEVMEEAPAYHLLL